VPAGLTICRGLSHKTLQVQIFKKANEMSITICSGLSHLTGWAAFSSENISGCFFKGRETLWGHNTVFIFDEYERVKADIQVGFYEVFLLWY
jgi:hypothetical protein